MINYEVRQNKHTLEGAGAALRALLIEVTQPKSLLDVGCGPGAWLQAAAELGIQDLIGIEGRIPENESLLCDANWIQEVNLTSDWSMGRTFDIALCLEVAEHLPESSAVSLIHKLCTHADLVIFSAAIPGQPGQHHINCQWPTYWQHLFNREGFACFDDLRWKIWDNEVVEPWYRQNIFRAVRSPHLAGSERRIPGLVHQAMLEGLIWESGMIARERYRTQIEQGCEGVAWYPVTLCKALVKKLARHLRKT